MKEIYKNIYTGNVILPNSPLKSINSYIIRGEERSLIIDTAFDHPQSEREFFDKIESLGIHKKPMDLYLTHLHADHTGLAYKFQQRYGGKVYSSAVDADYIRAMANRDYFSTHLYPAEFYGLHDDGDFFSTHPAVMYCAKGDIDFTIVKEGDILSVGEYEFEVLEVPGHTPDQTALYEKNHQLLFSGDHILDRITPNISFWRFEHGDSLGIYLESLHKIYELPVKIVFPAHRTVIYDHRRRIDELRLHHKERLNDIMQILSADGRMTVAEVASKMHWDFRAKDFSEFPPAQQWFASGEAMSHLEHLRTLGLVKMIMLNEETPIQYYIESN